MNSNLNVYKFGGASVLNAEAVRNVGQIVLNRAATPLLIVVSAMAKTTNALEEVLSAYINGKEDVDQKFDIVKAFHWAVATELFEPGHEVFNQINDLFVEIEWVIEEEPEDPFDYLYDQIVSVGEFLSTRIVSAYLNSIGAKNTWVDARNVIKTDNAHREARVDWVWTEKMIQSEVKPILLTGQIVVTQGFIGCTSENFTSTLGREGSDFSAAIFANTLNAERLTVWKDVPGIMAGDPGVFDDMAKLDNLSYREAVEMSYYGAKVIHQKTIKPLQNKSIPLFVKSFSNPEGEGTKISTDPEAALPPIIMLAQDQVLIHISTKDYSFVGVHHLSKLFGQFAKLRIKINLMRNTAISFSVCCNNHSRKIKALIAELESEFTIVVEGDLELFTVRHANPSALEKILEERTVVFEERFMETVQCVVREKGL